jgi:hypothetical protein
MLDPEEVAAVVGIGEWGGEDAWLGGCGGKGSAGELAEGRENEEQGGDEGGHRVAGEPEQIGAVASSAKKRFPGFHGDAPEIEVESEVDGGLLDEVVISDGCATDGDHNLGLGGGVFEGGPGGGWVIGDVA